MSLDPKQIEDALSLPDKDGLVSLAAAGTAGTADEAGTGSTADAGIAGTQHAPPLPQPLLRLCGGNLQLGSGCSGGSAGAAPLEATFRLVAPLAGCEAGEAGPAGSLSRQTEESESAAGTADCSPARTRQLLMQPQPAASLGGAAADGDAWSAEGHRLASFESAAWPGHILTADSHSGTLLLQQSSLALAGPRSQTFLLRPAQHSATTAGAAGGQLAFTLEPLSQPGSTVVADGLGLLRLQVGGSRLGLGLRDSVCLQYCLISQMQVLSVAARCPLNAWLLANLPAEAARQRGRPSWRHTLPAGGPRRTCLPAWRPPAARRHTRLPAGSHRPGGSCCTVALDMHGVSVHRTRTSAQLSTSAVHRCTVAPQRVAGLSPTAATLPNVSVSSQIQDELYTAYFNFLPPSQQ